MGLTVNTKGEHRPTIQELTFSIWKSGRWLNLTANEAGQLPTKGRDIDGEAAGCVCVNVNAQS